MAEVYINKKDLRNKIDDWYKLKEPLVPDNLAEGFVQMDILISKQPPADVIERTKIDKAIEEIDNIDLVVHDGMNHYYKSGEEIQAEVLKILRKNIGR